MIAYVINLDRRKDRWEKAQELWSPYFELVRYPAIEAFNGKTTNGALGCKLSHVYLVEKYLKNRPIVVLEDDAEPTKRCDKTIAACMIAAHLSSNEWDYINCGPFLDLTPLNLPCATLSESPCWCFLRTNYSHNTHMVMYNNRSLPLLKASLKSKLPVDMFLGKHAKEQWVPMYLLATQYKSKSDVSNPKVDPRLLYEKSEELLTAYAKTNRHKP